MEASPFSFRYAEYLSEGGWVKASGRTYSPIAKLVRRAVLASYRNTWRVTVTNARLTYVYNTGAFEGAVARKAMPRSPIDFATVRDIGLALPGVEESTAYGSPALKVHGKLMLGIAVNRSAEHGSLGVCLNFDDRAELLAAAPDIYYVTDHYVPYNVVLVRLSRVNRDVLRDLLGMAHKFVTRNAAPHPPGRKRRKRDPRK